MRENIPQVFNWKGINHAGEPVGGIIESSHIVLAKNQLFVQGIRKLSIKPQYQVQWFHLQRRIRSKDITDMCRQLNVMMHAGIPVLQSLQIIKESSQGSEFKQLLTQIQFHIERGLSLSEAFQRFPSYFNELFYHLIQIGECSGKLEPMLNQLIAYREATEKMHQQLSKALTYPIFVCTFAMIITLGLLILVVPQFQQLFHAFGANLPPMTLFIIHLSDLIQNHGLLWTSCFSMSIVGISLSKQRYKIVSMLLEKAVLNCPIFGMITQKIIFARLSRTLSITYAAGIPLVEALSFTSGVPHYQIYRHSIMQVREKIIQGQSLHHAMTQMNIFPAKMTQMLAVGEASGHIDTMLQEIANMYEAEVTQAIDRFSHLLEPIIMGIVGILVGGLIIGMYLPIFKMGSLL